jgi:hypothetical protein
LNAFRPTLNASDAVFRYVPYDASVTVRPTPPAVPAARSPRFHVTVPPENVPPFVAETNVAPAGSVSVSTALSAGVGPAFA